MCEECGCAVDTAAVCPECGGRMVLINGQATCLSCGASPLDTDPSEHKEHHHHHAGHAHEETKAVPDDLAKLRILLPHWIEHNDEHAASFREWADKAREMGLEEVARRIEEAVEQMAASNEALTAALGEIER